MSVVLHCVLNCFPIWALSIPARQPKFKIKSLWCSILWNYKWNAAMLWSCICINLFASCNCWENFILYLLLLKFIVFWHLIMRRLSNHKNYLKLSCVFLLSPSSHIIMITTQFYIACLLKLIAVKSIGTWVLMSSGQFHLKLHLIKVGLLDLIFLKRGKWLTIWKKKWNDFYINK